MEHESITPHAGRNFRISRNRKASHVILIIRWLPPEEIRMIPISSDNNQQKRFSDSLSESDDIISDYSFRQLQWWLVQQSREQRQLLVVLRLFSESYEFLETELELHERRREPQ